MKDHRAFGRHGCALSHLAIAALTIGAGCNTEVGTDSNRANKRILPQTVADPADAGLGGASGSPVPESGVGTERHSRSPEAVLVGWEGIGESTSDLVEKLTAKVENTTDKRIEATIFTLMLAPGASTRTEHLVGIYVLKPREAARLTINVADLPVQTSGVATALELSAKYVGSSGPVAPRTQTAISPPSTSTSYSSTLYLTYEDDFLTATVRSEHEESRINGENFRLGKLQALKGLKLDGVLVTEVALSDVHPQRIIMLPKDFFPPPSLQGDARK